MEIRIKSYNGLSDALADQAFLVSQGISANIENTYDIHPSLIGQVFLSVPKELAGRAIILLQNKPKINNEDT